MLKGRPTSGFESVPWLHRCDDCNHDFPTKAALKKHRGGPKHAETVQKKRLGVDKPPIKCMVCGKTYAQRQSLYKHYRDGNPLKSSSRRALHCEDCGQYFRFKSTSSVLPIKVNVRILVFYRDGSRPTRSFCSGYDGKQARGTQSCERRRREAPKRWRERAKDPLLSLFKPLT